MPQSVQCTKTTIFIKYSALYQQIFTTGAKHAYYNFLNVFNGIDS